MYSRWLEMHLFWLTIKGNNEGRGTGEAIRIFNVGNIISDNYHWDRAGSGSRLTRWGWGGGGSAVAPPVCM